MDTSITLAQAKKDPSKHFKTPKTLVEDPTFSRKEKLDILKSWEDHLRLLQKASDENMPADNDAADAVPGSNLAALKEAMDLLSEKAIEK